jgi:hypothetical protein
MMIYFSIFRKTSYKQFRNALEAGNAVERIRIGLESIFPVYLWKGGHGLPVFTAFSGPVRL